MNILETNQDRLKRGGYLVWNRVQKVSGDAETLTVPDLSSTTGSAAVVRAPGDDALSVSITDKNTVSVTGVNNGKAWIVTHHSRLNYGPEDSVYIG